jgi:flavin-dependent dehydrogenase
VLKEFQLGFRGRLARFALPIGAALSRSRLDAELVGMAIHSGVRFLPETQGRVGEISEGTRLVHLVRRGETREIRARVLLVAWGLSSRHLEPSGAPQTVIAPESPVGAGCVIQEAPSCYAAGTIFMAVGPEGYAGLVRVEDGSLNVATALRPAFLRRHGTPAAAAAGILAESGFAPISALATARWQGTARLTRRTYPLADERLFLLGDAAGYVEPFTGEGIAWALQSGQAIAPLALRAMDRWDHRLAREWDGLHQRLVRRRQIVCRVAAGALHRPWLARLGFEVLARMPGAAGAVIHYVNAPPAFSEAN